MGREQLADLSAALEALLTDHPVLIVDAVSERSIGMLVLGADGIAAARLRRLDELGGGGSYLALSDARCDALGLALVAARNDDPHNHPITTPIRAVASTHGMGVEERALTIRVAADPRSGADEILRGGHVLPHRAARGGVLTRAGYTEAAIELPRLAGMAPAGVLGEVLDDDGAVRRGEALFAYADRHGIPVVTLGQVIAAVRRRHRLVRRQVTAGLPTRDGTFVAVGYQALLEPAEHMALVHGDVEDGEDVLVYIHLSCWEGDVFRSRRCDCRARLDAAVAAIRAAGRGVVVHLANPGHAHHHEARARDAELRDFGVGAQILADLGLRTIRVISDHPRPLPGLDGYGLSITGFRPWSFAGRAID